MDKKYLSIKEFRELGYLQELNRIFLHPLGLALEVVINDDGNEIISGILDYRDDPTCIIYDLKNSDKERIERFINKETFIQCEKTRIGTQRCELFGYIVEPISK